MIDFTERGLITAVIRFFAGFENYQKNFFYFSTITWLGTLFLRYIKNVVFPFVGNAGSNFIAPMSDGVSLDAVDYRNYKSPAGVGLDSDSAYYEYERSRRPRSGSGSSSPPPPPAWD